MAACFNIDEDCGRDLQSPHRSIRSCHAKLDFPAHAANKMKTIHHTRGIRLWAAVELLCVLIAILTVCNMLYHSSLGTVATILSVVYPVASQNNPFWTGYDGETSPWQWGGPDQSQEYWFNETQVALSTMQQTYWNGTYWVRPSVNF